MPNIKGETRVYAYTSAIEASKGAIKQAVYNSKAEIFGAVNYGYCYNTLTFNASDSSSVYQNSAHVKPLSCATSFYIKY